MAYTAVPTKSPGDTWSASDHNTYVRDNFAAGVPDIFEAKGDIAVGTADNAATRVPVLSTNGYVLIADSDRTSGVKWGLDPVQDLAQAKGDLLVGSAADTLGRLAVSSTDGYILYSDSAETLGVKWAASPATIIDAKGDLLVGSAADTLARLPVSSTNGRTLTSDSAATYGVRWGTTGVIEVYARYNTNAAQAIANNSATIINFQNEDYDTASAVTTGAAWKFTANSTGYYLVSAAVAFRSTSIWGVNEQATLRLYKDGSQETVMGGLFMHVAGTYEVAVNAATMVQLNNGQYIDIRALQNSGAALNIQSTGALSHVAIARVF